MQTKAVDRVPEWRFQAEVVARLHKLEAAGWPFTCAGDMNRAQRNQHARNEAKVTGLTAGEPDVRVYCAGGKLISIELKTPDGRRSNAQKTRHALLGRLGFEVITLKAPTPGAMADEVEAILRGRLDAALIPILTDQPTDGPNAR